MATSAQGLLQAIENDATRITLVVLARLMGWRAALTFVKPETLIRWQRKGFGLFWRWKSKACGRPSPAVQRLIATMAQANVTWDDRRRCLTLIVGDGHEHVSGRRIS